MTDGFGRTIDYLRVSVTDRCNLRCRYCMPEDLPSIRHDHILRYEEILRVCAAAARLGVHSFRVTGGEPLVRKGCLDFLRRLKKTPGANHVTVTTNGVLLEPYIDELAAMGIDGINISLDTLDPVLYRNLTGQDALAAVLDSLEQVVGAGLQTKVNCVLMGGVNDGELPRLAALAETRPVDVRFIELMPTGAGKPFRPLTGGEARKILLAQYPDLRPDGEPHGPGPARYYRSDALRGAIGFIDALSNHFCAGCNRVRLTSEGFLKLCLYHGAGISLRDLLRSGADDKALQNAIFTALNSKPERHFFGEEPGDGIATMSRIGG